MNAVMTFPDKIVLVNNIARNKFLMTFAEEETYKFEGAFQHTIMRSVLDASLLRGLWIPESEGDGVVTVRADGEVIVQGFLSEGYLPAKWIPDGLSPTFDAFDAKSDQWLGYMLPNGCVIDATITGHRGRPKFELRIGRYTAKIA